MFPWYCKFLTILQTVALNTNGRWVVMVGCDKNLGWRGAAEIMKQKSKLTILQHYFCTSSFCAQCSAWQWGGRRAKARRKRKRLHPLIVMQNIEREMKIYKIRLQNGGLDFCFIISAATQPRFWSHPIAPTRRSCVFLCDSLQYCREFAIS